MVDRLNPLHINLPDVLLQLPLLGVVDDCVWQPLSPAGRSSLRQASSSCRQLADSLITDVSLIADPVQHPLPSKDSDAQPPSLQANANVPSEARPASLTHEQRETWPQALNARARFLSRLPRLTALQLQHWPDEAALLAMLTRYGTATGFRLTELTLHGKSLTAAAGERVCQACPRLDTLALHSRGEGSADPGDDVLHPMRELPLTSLTVSAMRPKSSAALVSLSRLSRLRRIDLYLCHALPQLCQPLAALSQLQHCRISGYFANLSFVDAAALFTLSHLTHLDLFLRYTGTPLGTPAADEMAAAVAPLARLAKLQHLALGPFCAVDSIVFAPLLQLSSLTSLSADRFDMLRPTPPLPTQSTPQARLPVLSNLQLNGEMRPSHLLLALEPLLPLSALEDFCSDALCLDVGALDDADAALEARSLRSALGHLARAPLLGPLHRLDISSCGVFQMAYADLCEGLRPVVSRLQTLVLDQLNLGGAEWGALGALLPQLHLLELRLCVMHGNAMATLAAHWPGLAQLHVRDCMGLSPTGWLGLAVGRADALTVFVEPCQAEERVEWVLPCQALQEQLFGRHYITFATA